MNAAGKPPLATGPCAFRPDYLQTIDSTQDEARRFLALPERCPTVVYTFNQTAGRGRRGTQWWMAPGDALAATFIVPSSEWAGASTHGLPLAAGMAVATAIESLCGISPTLKWPNDVLLGGLKCAGILIEMAHHVSGECVALIGIGINVNAKQMPQALSASATSVRIERPRSGRFGLHALARSLHNCLGAEFELLRTETHGETMARWRLRDDTAGRTYTADSANGTIVGVAVGIDDSGALILRCDDGGVHTVFAATSSTF